MKIAGTWATVLGVAADTRYRELTVLRPTAYRPRDQFEAASPFLAVRTAGDPISIALAIRSAGQAMWRGATFTSPRRLESLLVRAARAFPHDRTRDMAHRLT